MSQCTPRIFFGVGFLWGKGEKKEIEIEKWYFVTEIILTYCEENFFSDREKLLKFEAEGQEFAKFLRSLEKFIQTVKGQSNFW